VIETKIGDETAQSNVDKLLEGGICNVIGGSPSSSSFCRRGTYFLSLTDRYTSFASMSDGTSTDLHVMVC
jgi:hypothetical protein